MPDFIFGTLSSLERRVELVQKQTLGVVHGHQLDPLAPGPGDKPIVSVTVGLKIRVESMVCELLEPQTLSLSLKLIATDWDTMNWHYFQTWQGNLPSQPEGTIVRYKITAIPADGSDPIPADEGALFSYVVGNPLQPAWAEEAIIYQIFPDRFHPGNNREWNETKNLDERYGGTIRGIIDNIDYVAGMGFNCLWLNPFFPDHTYHGYHAVDYFSINPRLGTADDIYELVQEAHKRNIRILLDFVANHWGSKHPTFQAALKDRNSEYYDWYNWNEWPDDYETFFAVKDLPQINVNHEPARQHLLEATRYWLSEFGFDGFRLDYSPGPTHDFWVDFRKIVQEEKPDAWIFGEVTDTPETQLSYWGRLHGCLDFILLEALRHTFALGSMSLTEFDAFLEKHEAYFPTGFSRPTFLDNHDMDRFLWLAKGDRRKLKLAALCQFTLSGQPTVYYGTEVGVSQIDDMMPPEGPHNMAQARLPMRWGSEQDQDLRQFYRWLIHFRRQHPALWRGDRQTILLNDPAGVYVYSRADSQETIFVAMNLSDQTHQVRVAGHDIILSPWTGEIVVD
jgi:cyclomaltodextrinase